MYAYHNTSYTPINDIKVSPCDRGFLLGDGIFETMRASNGKITHIDQHLKRFITSADFFAIDLHESEQSLYSICETLLEKNKLLQHSVSIRMTLTRGLSNRGINLPDQQRPTILITTTHIKPPTTPFISAMITDIKRNECSPITYHKTLNYLEPILARSQAQQLGYDEGIMLNTKGAITESSAANLFIVKGGVIYTPPISDGVLPGIMRDNIIAYCKEHSIPLLEQSIVTDDLLQADEAFQTNSLIQVQAIKSINKHTLDTNPGNLTDKISKILRLL
jgi:branched-chain amino acid aminotransferase